VQSANFVGVHQATFVERYDVLALAAPGARSSSTARTEPDEVWDTLPRSMQQQILDKGIKFYVVDAYTVADETGMGRRINTIMQTCFFALLNEITGEPLLTRDEAIGEIKKAIERTYGKRGETVVAAELCRGGCLPIPYAPRPVPESSLASSCARRCSRGGARVRAFGNGAAYCRRRRFLPVSALPGRRYLPEWARPSGKSGTSPSRCRSGIRTICIQCGKCVFVCPHAVIREKDGRRRRCRRSGTASFKTAPARFREWKDNLYTLQVAVEDCTGCASVCRGLPCQEQGPAEVKAINMAPQAAHSRTRSGELGLLRNAALCRPGRDCR
jgi:pyruvate-ferredoxin/flavodoxin oxidoreductase